MKTAYINRKVVNGAWGGGNMMTAALYKYLPDFGIRPIDHLINVVDYVFIVGLGSEADAPSADKIMSYINLCRSSGLPVPRTLLRVNENDARKATSGVDRNVIDVATEADKVVFVSDWLKSYYEQQFPGALDQSRSSVIINGISDAFKPGKKFADGKTHIVTHHWSNNELKGFDYYEYLDRFVGEHSDRYTFTYIGRERGTFKNTRVIAPLFGEALTNELGKYDVYVTGTRADPGPNHCIESIASGIPTYAFSGGGGAVEFVGVDHTFSGFDDLKTLLLKNEFKTNEMTFSPWRDVVEKYVKEIAT